MGEIIKRLSLGLSLIFFISLILFFSDSRAKQQGDTQKIAIFQFSTRPLLDDTVKGILESLKKNGFENKKTAVIDIFNAESDMATAKNISQNIISQKYDLAITVSTPALQVFANANRNASCKHIFATVTDPYSAGVSISGAKPHEHPPYMAGIGTFQPVERAFELAKTFCPNLKKVGIVWNPAETCSEACTKKARLKAAELGIELIETNVENSSAVSEAANALIIKGAEAIYVGGDNTVDSAIDALIASASKKNIAVFTNNPDDAARGAVFGLGANYIEIGKAAGNMASRVLDGTPCSSFPITNLMPEKLDVCEKNAASAKPSWNIPPDKVKIINQNNLNSLKSIDPARLYKIGIVYFGPDPGSEDTIAGLKEGLSANSLIEGENLKILIKHANGEISAIPQIIQSYIDSDVDLIVPLTTPCLTAACAMVKKKPVVFASVYNPVAAGAASSYINHLPNITGIASMPPIKETTELCRSLYPSLKKVGTIFNPSEANSKTAVEHGEKYFDESGILFCMMTANTSNDVLEALYALLHKKINLLWISGDNTVLKSIDTLLRVSQKNELPTILNDPGFAEKGALAACGISFHKAGFAAASLVKKILSGENPKDIPILNISAPKIAINFTAAANLKYKFPQDVLNKASVFFGIRDKYGRPARIALVKIVRSPLLDRSSDGIYAGLQKAGLKKDIDFTVTEFCADGENAQIPLIMQAVNNGNYDILITQGTPVMVAAAKLIKNIPIVFTVASDPVLLNIFPPSVPQPNITGVHDDPPLAELIELAQENELKSIHKVATLWDPSQPNSEISVKKLRRACAEKKLELIEQQVSRISELPEMTSAISAKKPDIIVISADNVTVAGFPAIYAVARKNNIPVYTTEPGLLVSGAKGAVGDDYFQWGVQSAKLAAKVLAGVSPADLPFERTKVQQKLINQDAGK